MAFELIKVSELPELTTPSDPNVIPIQDGDYLKRISFENLKEAVTDDVADDLAAEVTAREGAVSDEATARGNADTAILADLASPYSASATYAVGDYCTKDGQLYRCTTAISTAEAWTAAHWSAVALGDDTRDLRSALNDTNNALSTTKIATIPPYFNKGIFDSTKILYFKASGNYMVSIACLPYTTYTLTKNIATNAFKIAYVKTDPAKDVPVYGYVEKDGSTVNSTEYTTGEDAVQLIICTGTTDPEGHFTITFKSTVAKKRNLGYMRTSGDLSNGDALTLPKQHVINRNRYVFNANVGTFNAIVFSRGHTLTVDNTNIVISYSYGGGYTIPHGLTIGNNITLVIENDESYNNSLIRLESDGNVFNYTNAVPSPLGIGDASIQSQGSTLTNCVFSWTSRNINKPIWMFGDSYFMFYSARWTYYAAEDNNLENSMLNAFAGQGSLSAYEDLTSLLSVSIPRMIVWCLGMNDGDPSSYANETWKKILQLVIQISCKYGIELVLYTPPTTPTVRNTFKDNIIRASGYRYIEADLAVRIDSSGNWVSGALDNDNTHPTEIGAKIIYNRFLADLPEMMCG